MRPNAYILAIVATALLAPAVQPAFAQGAAIEEIVVTARKRNESLLDIPLTVAAFSAEQIEQAGYTTIADLVTAVPGVTYESYEAEGRGDSPSFRGVSTNTGDPTLQNSSKFIDGVYVSGSLYTVLLDNLERVEITKGPQSALFGRASFSGAINYITKKPGNEFEGNVRGSVAEEREYQLSASISGPLVEDRLLFRLSAGTFGQGSPYNNVTNGEEMGEQDINSFSATVRLTPSPQLTADLMLMYTDAQFGEAARATTALSMSELAFPEESVIGGGTQQLDNPGIDSETMRASLNATYELASGHELSFIAGTGSEDTVNEADGDYSPSNNLAGLWFLCVGPYAGPGCELFQTVTEREIESSFAELRLASPDQGPWRWLVGTAYFEEDFNTARIRNFRQPPSFKTSTNLSVFGSVSFDLSEKLTLGLDGRYQTEEIELDIPDTGRSQSDDFDSFLPRVLAEYQLADTTLLYVSAAKGNKPGNFNASAPPGFLTVEEEEMWNYELGAKLSAMDGNLSLQAAAYMIDWSNQVYRFNDPDPNYGSYFINAGETDVAGLDISVAANLSEFLRASLAYSWIDTEFQVFESNNARTVLGNADVSGNETPRTANNSLFASLQYRCRCPVIGISAATEWFAGVDVSYRGEMFIDELNLETIEARTLVNVRAGVGTENAQITAFVNNLTDNDALTTGFRYGAVALVGLPMPRQAGVSVSFSF
ncbi:TonB-dependent receptor [Candidatus Foliamicus sp.]